MRGKRVNRTPLGVLTCARSASFPFLSLPASFFALVSDDLFLQLIEVRGVVRESLVYDNLSWGYLKEDIEDSQALDECEVDENFEIDTTFTLPQK